MASLEKRMRDLDLLESKPASPFLPDAEKKASRFSRPFIGDDHVPFMERGVDVLHMIPSPFPSHIWHTMNDDGEHLDLPTCRDWSKIVTAFTIEWMECSEFMPKEATAKVARSGTSSGHESKRTEL